jgi:hypothetical protein
MKNLEKLSEFNITSNNIDLFKGGCCDPTGGGGDFYCSYTSDCAYYDDNGTYLGTGGYVKDASKVHPIELEDNLSIENLFYELRRDDFMPSKENIKFNF